MDSFRSPSTLRFDDYVVDLHSGQLQKDGIRIRLQEKPLRVLAALVEHQGQLVSRDELHKRLWPDTTFVDFEVGLNTAVKKLRVALCDDADKPRYIETIPKRGYRFIASAEVLGNNHRNGGDGPTPLVPEPPSPGLVASRNPTRSWAYAAGIAALMLIGLVLWYLTPLPDPKTVEIFPVTTSANLDYLVRPATDGARIFYVQHTGDHYNLMQVSVNGGDAQRMQGPFPNTLIWDVSPDGSQYLITSFTRRGEPSQLWTWPVQGGSPVRLPEMISGSATYSPDGKWIAFHANKELWIGNADGSVRHKLMTFASDVDDPAWSPDGSRLRFTLSDEQRDTSTIWEIRLDGTGLRQVLPAWGSTPRLCCGTWSPDGRYFVFVDVHDAHRLWAIRENSNWFRRNTPGPFPLVSEAEGLHSPVFGRDGKHVYFYTAGFRTELQSFDLSRHQFSALLPGVDALMPGISLDGKWIAFARATRAGLWRSRTDGADLRELPVQGMSIGFPRWSPDDKTVVFSAQAQGTAPNVYVLDAEGGNPTPLVMGRENLGDPDWSPDGTSVVVREDVPDGGKMTSRIALVPWHERQLHDVAGSDGMMQPRWSADGKWIAAVTDDRLELRLYSVAREKWRTIAHGKELGLPVLSGESSDIYYQDLLSPGEAVMRVSVPSGKIEKVMDFQNILDTGVARCVFIALTADGHPVVNFDHGSDIHAATLSLP